MTALRIVPLSMSTSSFPSAILGCVAGYDPAQGALVDFPGNSTGPLPARLLIAISSRALRQAAESQCAVALLFENGDPALPLLVGIVQPPSGHEACVDGERIVLTGEEEIELRCGESSITLSKEGKLVLRGAYVETRAKGMNRIKGGAVQIN